MKVMTVVGTRPEIIRLSSVIGLLDQYFDHTLVHTDQNPNPELSARFFEEMKLRPPDLSFGVDTSSLGSTLADVFRKTELAIEDVRPDAFLVLGDTNSALSLILAKRMHVRTFHMEAGNRCFDKRVPEETNRKIIDHAADINLVYSERARSNLLSEGVSSQNIYLTGSPLREVIEKHASQIENSKALDVFGVERNRYFLASLHRQENVDTRERLVQALTTLQRVADRWGMEVLLSTHPRTAMRIRDFDLQRRFTKVRCEAPFGFFDFCKLQVNAKCVLSDSGSISEESSILQFKAVTIRDVTERPEAVDTGNIVVSGLEFDNVVSSVEMVLDLPLVSTVPWEYRISNTSQRVAKVLRSFSA